MDEVDPKHIDSDTKRVLWISITALGILLCLMPIAMIQEPNLSYRPGVTPWPKELQYGLMLAGMSCAILSVTEAVILWLPALRGRAYGGLCAGLAFTNFVIGYRTFPYWSIGVYQLSLAGELGGQLDPKFWLNVPDSDAFWNTWFLAMLLCLLLYWPIELAIAGLALRAALRRRYLHASLWVPLFLARVSVIYALSPQFYYWFFD